MAADETAGSFGDRLHARVAGLLPRVPTDFALEPCPEPQGRAARGQRMADGRFLWSGFLVQASDAALWDLPLPDPDVARTLHDFAWIDDMAAAADRRAQSCARNWAWDWIARYGRGRGPGWTPVRSAARLSRLIDHADLLLADVDQSARRDFFRTVGTHVAYLRRRARTVSDPRGRLLALVALARAEVALGWTQAGVKRAGRLPRILSLLLDAEGGARTRSPEDLLDLFAPLARLRADLYRAGAEMPRALGRRLAAMAPLLRALCHADGGLARFHGGGRGALGRIERALADAAPPSGPVTGQAMGFVRLVGGRTTVILDASAPPPQEYASAAHASTLAFEMTVGRRPMIVNCGPGHAFGPKWRRAGRATPSHSTLALEGLSSARLGAGEPGVLRDGPSSVVSHRYGTEDGTAVDASHDGWSAGPGLIHDRRIALAGDGRTLWGEDVLRPVEGRVGRTERRAFRVRFHLHPEVAAEWMDDGQGVTVMTKSGEIWAFRHEGPAALSLEGSVYLDAGAAAPRQTRQIVLTAETRPEQGADGIRLTWYLANASQSPQATRDTRHDDRPVLV